MKTKWLILFVCVLKLTACNFKEPLKDILQDANSTPADVVYLRTNIDTLLLSASFPALNDVDSVFANGLDVKALDVTRQKLQIVVTDSSSILHHATVMRKGEKVSLILYYITGIKSQSGSSSVLPVGSLNNRLLFSCSRIPGELYVLWQNVLLPDNFVSFNKKGFSIVIPKEARDVEHSQIRVFTENGNQSVDQFSITLLSGIPVTPQVWAKKVLTKK